MTASKAELEREILERKKAEEALRKSEEEYSSLFDNMMDGFAYCEMMFDEAGKPVDFVYLQINDAFESITGLKRDLVVGKKVTQAIPGIKEANPELFETYGRVALTRKKEKFEVFFKPLSMWLSISVYSPRKGYFAAVFEDITERKLVQGLLEERTAQVEEYAQQMEQLAEERLEKLKDTERLAAIGATAGMVGHDIRNPLQAIIGDVYLAKGDVNSLPQDDSKTSLQESLAAIEKNTKYINKIVADLQDYARPLNPHVEETDLNGIISDLIIKNGIPTNIKRRVKIAKETQTLTTDPAYMKRILGNLITNAVQAMPDGGRLTINATAKDNNTIITVQDTGVGIPEDAKPKLFMPLFTTKSRGQGFGLSVVKRMTEALNGAVTFESQQGKGTKFTIQIPTNAKSH